MADQEKLTRFEQAVLPHMDAAYNLARWLTRNDHDAEDVVQEAYLRAFKFYGDLRGEESRPWLLTIVRNTCYTWLKQNRAQDLTTEFDEEIHSPESEATNPETLFLESVDRLELKQALDELPAEFREAVILRELEGMQYKEIADVTGVPIGTVMSRLARARKRLVDRLTAGTKKEP